MRWKIGPAILFLGVALGLWPGPARAQRASPERALAALGALSESFQALADQVSPAVVQIIASGYAPAEQAEAAGLGALTLRDVGGSGVVLDPDGYIVTNGHVVAGAHRVQVRFPARPVDGPPGTSILAPRGQVLGAQVVAVDPETDLAVLRVEAHGLPHLELGDSDELRKGQLVFAFGSPAGLENSVTMGVVSAVARQLRPEDPMIYVQTDAPINSGSSGGPLVDARGRVVGINTFILSKSGGSEGIGFAAPSNIVRNVFEQIRSSGFVHRGEIGIHAQTISPALAAGLQLPREWGVVLGDVVPGSPAERAGLRPGDVIVSLNGKVMENGRQLEVNLYRRPIGDLVTLEVLRGDERRTARVSVLERPDDPRLLLSRSVTPQENLISALGIVAVDLDSKVARLMRPLRRASGVVVVARSADAPPSVRGLRPGDVIYSVNRAPVSSVRELRDVLSSLGVNAPVVLQVERAGRLMFLAFELR